MDENQNTKSGIPLEQIQKKAAEVNQKMAVAEKNFQKETELQLLL